MTGLAPGTEHAPTRREWIGLAVLSIGLGLIVLDGTIVGVALPAIITDLHLDLTQAQLAARVGCAVVTVSDSRTLQTDTSGKLAIERLDAMG